jgi:alanyl-tRNA synthetase
MKIVAAERLNAESDHVILSTRCCAAPDVWMEWHRKHAKSGPDPLAGVVEGKVAFAVGVTGQALQRFSAIDLVRTAVLAMGGQGGGGKPEFAQGEAPNGERASEGLMAVRLALEATKG